MADTVKIKITGDGEIYLEHMQKQLTAAKELADQLTAVIEKLSSEIPGIDG